MMYARIAVETTAVRTILPAIERRLAFHPASLLLTLSIMKSKS